MTATTAHVVKVGLDDIVVLPTRLRALRPDVVADLALSMRVWGQLQPIVLRQQRGTGYYLVAGRHPLEAAKKLQWSSMQAVVFDDMEGDAAELAEIDENL